MTREGLRVTVLAALTARKTTGKGDGTEERGENKGTKRVWHSRRDGLQLFAKGRALSSPFIPTGLPGTRGVAPFLFFSISSLPLPSLYLFFFFSLLFSLSLALLLFLFLSSRGAVAIFFLFLSPLIVPHSDFLPSKLASSGLERESYLHRGRSFGQCMASFCTHSPPWDQRGAVCCRVLVCPSLCSCVFLLHLPVYYL